MYEISKEEIMEELRKAVAASEPLVSKTSDPIKAAMYQAANKWTFDTNGHKWSNNDNTARDNFNSFCEGFKTAVNYIKENRE